MKKFAIATLALAAIAASAADSVSLESQRQTNVGGEHVQQFALGFKKDLKQNLSGDVSISTTQTSRTQTLGARLEAGLTPTFALPGGITGYTRVALGENLGTGKAVTYYSIEPGIQAPVGPVTAKVGFRYRSATDSAFNDQTHTVRTGVSYALTKVDSIGVRYDHVRGDATQNNWALNYARSF